MQLSDHSYDTCHFMTMNNLQQLFKIHTTIKQEPTYTSLFSVAVTADSVTKAIFSHKLVLTLNDLQFQSSLGFEVLFKLP